MIGSLKPYPNMKDSGVPSLGEVPEHWPEMRAKYFFREIDLRSTSGKEELLSVSHITGVTPRSQKKVTMFMAESGVGYKICQAGDLVVNTMWAWMGALGVAKETGIVSPSYAVYRPLHPERLDPVFVDHLLRTPQYVQEFVCRSAGITTSRLRLYPEQFLQIPLLSPPIQEQKLIAKFINALNYRIRKYTSAKQKLISEVAELRESLTEEALTNADTQSLRMSWVADVVVRPVERAADQVYTPVGLFNRGRGIFHKAPLGGADLGDSDFFWIEAGDLIFSGQFAWEGAIAIADEADAGCIASHRYPVMRGKPRVAESAYLWAFFRTRYGQLLLNVHSRGAAGRNRPLNPRTLLKEHIPIPPMSQQQQIAEMVTLEKCLRRATTEEARLLRENRNRVVAEVLTGKVDVRNAALALAAELEQHIPFSESEDESLCSVNPEQEEEIELVEEECER